MKYPTIFHFVSEVFNKGDVACVLIGGFAVNFYKASRNTKDVDFLTTRENYDKILDLLKKEGFKEEYIHQTFARLKPDKWQYMEIDFMFVEKGVLEKIIKAGQEVNIGGQKFTIPSLFHLIALKLHSIKDNKKREYKDLLDIMELIRNNNVDIKNTEFKELCLKYGNEYFYQRIIEHLS